jgi:HEAT repeat protein
MVAVPQPAPEDLRRLIRNASGYVTSARFVEYSHTSYRLGVLAEVADSFLGDALPCVGLLAASSSEHLRRGVCEAAGLLAKAYPEDVLPTLKRMLRVDWRREGFAAAALAECAGTRPEETIDELLVLLGSDNHYVAHDAEQALVRGLCEGPESIFRSIERVARSASPTRLRAIRVLAGAKGRFGLEVMATLRDLAGAPDWHVRREVALVCGLLGRSDPERWAKLLDCLSRDSHWLVQRAAEASLQAVNRGNSLR